MFVGSPNSPTAGLSINPWGQAPDAAGNSGYGANPYSLYLVPVAANPTNSLAADGGVYDESATFNLWLPQTGSSIIPEPASLLLWSGLGAVGLIAAWRRRKRGA
jgi:hypothetical protein